jgi:thiamine-monophosphate kinase
VARLREGAVARECGAHAMIDVSDGLALDLHRLADASGVGFELSDVPVAGGATLDEALAGGEDYELVIAASRTQAEEIRTAFDLARLRAPLEIGAVVGAAERRTLGNDALARLGWQHTLG